MRRVSHPSEAEAVDDKELRLRQQAQLVRAGIEGMRIEIGTDQARHLDIGAADPAHDVFQDAERDQHAAAPLPPVMAVPGEKATEDHEPPANTARVHAVSYHLSAYRDRASGMSERKTIDAAGGGADHAGSARPDSGRRRR
jgi:hypothetical protein